jgi:MarR family 2-MHQ and catechol resistance regulon transcriptional repressor
VKKHDWTEFVSSGHRAVVTTVRVAERLTKAADRFLKPYRLTLAQFNLLAVLMQEAEGLPQSRIGARLVVSRANVTGLLRRMKSRGLCETHSDESDARIKNVRITASGAKLMDRIAPAYFKEIDRLTQPLRDGDLARVSEALDRLEKQI